MERFISQFRAVFSMSAFGAWAGRVLPRVLLGLAVLLVFVVIGRLAAYTIRSTFKRLKADVTAGRFLELLARYAIVVVGALTALTQAGVNTGSVVASLGVAGLTVGFAARDALSNVIAGLFIFWDRPFVIGDLIEVSDKYGRVETITLRSTRIVTVDGKMLAIPNTAIVNSIVTSYTNQPHLRLDIDVTIAVTENIARVRELLLAIVAGDARFLETPAPRVIVKALNDYNVAISFQVWIDDEKKHIAVRFELRERAFEVLRAAGVDMPFETFALTPIEVRERRAA